MVVIIECVLANASLHSRSGVALSWSIFFFLQGSNVFVQSASFPLSTFTRHCFIYAHNFVRPTFITHQLHTIICNQPQYDKMKDFAKLRGEPLRPLHPQNHLYFGEVILVIIFFYKLHMKLLNMGLT